MQVSGTTLLNSAFWAAANEGKHLLFQMKNEVVKIASGSIP